MENCKIIRRIDIIIFMILLKRKGLLRSEYKINNINSIIR